MNEIIEAHPLVVLITAFISLTLILMFRKDRGALIFKKAKG